MPLIALHVTRNSRRSAANSLRKNLQNLSSHKLQLHNLRSLSVTTKSAADG